MRRLSAWLLAASLLSSAAVRAQEKPAPERRGEIETIVREYLLAHPEILIEMSQRLRQRQDAEKRNATAAALRTKRDELFGDASPASGAATSAPGAVTIVQFFDYRCGYCKRVAPVLKRVAAADPSLRLVYKEMPILGDDSLRAAKAALAAKRQNKYLAMHEALMQSADLSAEALTKLARAAGLDVDRWKRDMEGAEVKAEIDRVHALAASIGVDATPAFVGGDQMMPGAMDEDAFRKWVAELRTAGAANGPGLP
jgi:protein-disulfide isomerase